MTVRKVSVSEAQRQFSRLLNEIERTGVEIIVRRDGGPTKRTGPVVRMIKYEPKHRDKADNALSLSDPDPKSK
jgi:antitoxin (DNA-binding transcriptional repressor) of toxin-antitoxin stability system